MTKVVYTNREIMMAGLVVLACFALSYFFPVQGTYQNFASLLSFMVLIPAIYVKFILKKNLSDFGVQLGDWKKGVVLAGISLAFSLLLVYVLLNYTGFLETQSFAKSFKGHFGKFIFYETFFVGTLAVAFEFFFRGFVMGSVVSKMGRASILVQFAVFLVFLAITKALNLGSAYFMIIALFSGLIVYESRSLVYSLAFSWIFVLIADAIVVRLIS